MSIDEQRYYRRLRRSLTTMQDTAAAEVFATATTDDDCLPGRASEVPLKEHRGVSKRPRVSGLLVESSRRFSQTARWE